MPRKNEELVPRLTNAQLLKLWDLCGRYNVEFAEGDYVVNQLDSTFMPGWAEGWIGGVETTIYIGVDPDGNSHS